MRSTQQAEGCLNERVEALTAVTEPETTKVSARIAASGDGGKAVLPSAGGLVSLTYEANVTRRVST